MDFHSGHRALVGRAGVPSDSVAAILQRQTQELLDGITFGKADVWERYLDPRVSVTTEDGQVKTKREMVDYTKPLPTYISGDIRIVAFTAAVHGSVAVTTHVNDEETFRGHKLHCQYRSTDTWDRDAGGVAAHRLLGPGAPHRPAGHPPRAQGARRVRGPVHPGARRGL